MYKCFVLCDVVGCKLPKIYSCCMFLIFVYIVLLCVFLIASKLGRCSRSFQTNGGNGSEIVVLCDKKCFGFIIFVQCKKTELGPKWTLELAAVQIHCSCTHCPSVLNVCWAIKCLNDLCEFK